MYYILPCAHSSYVTMYITCVTLVYIFETKTCCACFLLLPSLLWSVLDLFESIANRHQYYANSNVFVPDRFFRNSRPMISSCSSVSSTHLYLTCLIEFHFAAECLSRETFFSRVFGIQLTCFRELVQYLNRLRFDLAYETTQSLRIPV